MSDSVIVKDNKLIFNYPFLVMSDNNNICKTWETALEDNAFKSEYDTFNVKDKEKINKNMKSRTCQTINNINQCFTTAGQLETCSPIKKDNPNNMNTILTKIKKQLSDKKKVDIKNLDNEMNKITSLADNLITQYSNRQEMLNMNEGYHNTIDESINARRKEETNLGDNLDKIDNLKEYTQEDIRDTRNSFFWYQSKNNIVEQIMRYSLLFFIICIVFYILMVPYNS
jgi:hypothetical protein